MTGVVFRMDKEKENLFKQEMYRENLLKYIL